MVELKDNRSKWRQIADIFIERIQDGTYPPGTRIPTVLEICGEFKVANRTAQKVTVALREEGWVYTESGMGSFVMEKPKAPDQR